MSINNYFRDPPKYIQLDCDDTSHPSTSPTPAQTTSFQQLLALFGYARIGQIVVAQEGSGVVTAGYITGISASADNVTLERVDDGTKVTISNSARWFFAPPPANEFYGPNYVNQNPIYGGIHNNFNGPTWVYQTSRNAEYLASTEALVGAVLYLKK
jgi:hypothetical protein